MTQRTARQAHPARPGRPGLTLATALARGAAAGAAGTTALNAVTYLDMAVRGRPASSTPEDTVEKLASKAGLEIPGDLDTRTNRVAGLAALTGLDVGIGLGAALGVVRWLGRRPAPVTGAVVATLSALVGANGPMTVLGTTDPRRWTIADWVADVVPHLAYGAVTAAVLDQLDAHQASRQGGVPLRPPAGDLRGCSGPRGRAGGITAVSRGHFAGAKRSAPGL